MTDVLTRGFRAQLTTAMDSVLRKALVDIMAIFESSLHDHQTELVQRGEEIANLKIKLQTAELKLKECEGGADVEVETNKRGKPREEAQKESEAVLKPSGQNCDVDYEVADDWCVPLGCDTTTQQDDGVCPSIRLRPLLIPLWRIPVIKQEETGDDIKAHWQGTGLSRSKRGTPLIESHQDTRDKSSQMHNQRTRRKPVRSDIKMLLQEIKEEHSLRTDGVGLRRRVRNLPGQEKKNSAETTRVESETTAAELKSIERKREEDNDRGSYRCKFCSKSFDTTFGRDARGRSHKTCRGCKKDFSFPRVLRSHKSTREKLKELLKRGAEGTKSHHEQKPSPTNKQLCDSNDDQPSLQDSASAAAHTCAFCNKTFNSRFKLIEHTRVHTGEKPFPCSVCPKWFRVKQSCQKHMMRMHQAQEALAESNGDLEWTKPLEDTEDNQEDVTSPSKGSDHATNHNRVEEQRNPGVRQRDRLQTKGVKSSNGFNCLFCHKFVRTKRALREHVRLHTGERPIKCEKCSAKFRTDQQLYKHKKRTHYPGAQSPSRREKAKSRLRRNVATKGNRKNHTEYYHN